MLALTLTAAMLADLLTFALAVSIHPIAGESNPLARLAFDGGLAGVAALKLTGTAVALLILARLARLHSKLRLRGALVGIALTLLAAGTNVYAVIQ